LSSLTIPAPATAANQYFRRFGEYAERVVAALLLLAVSPLIVFLAIVTFLLSGRSPWIAHRRVGWQGVELWVPKVRTMWIRRNRFPRLSHMVAVECIEDDIGPGLKSCSDARVASRFARFCRKHSLDELPQLALVVTGRMSLVGPRPVTASELIGIYGPHGHEILEAKPGLTGLWQVSGRNRLTATRRCALDLESVRHRSFRLYWKILLRTIPELFCGANSW
jgi:exopolysaccharide production protein ExoY